jgi:hypothetical protein
VGSTPRRTDWQTVNRKVTLTLTLTLISVQLVRYQSAWGAALPSSWCRGESVLVYPLRRTYSLSRLGLNTRETLGDQFSASRYWVELMLWHGQSAYPSWCRAPLWGPWPDFTLSFLCRTVALLLVLGRPLWREDGSVITVSSETTGFPFRRLLRLAGITVEVFYPLWREDGSVITVSSETTGFPFRRLLRLAGITVEVFLPASTRGIAAVNGRVAIKCTGQSQARLNQVHGNACEGVACRSLFRFHAQI